ncbi:hypothetical protein MY3957_008252 [Beauveria namnaoensis]
MTSATRPHAGGTCKSSWDGAAHRRPIVNFKLDRQHWLESEKIELALKDFYAATLLSEGRNTSLADWFSTSKLPAEPPSVEGLLMEMLASNERKN